MFPNYIPTWSDPKSTFIKRKETELKIDFLHSGGQIYVFGADRPDLMRGPNPMGVVLDEYSVMKPEVWESVVQPVMRANPKAWCWFLFTPRGKNHAHTAYQRGLRGDDEWKSWMLKADESGIYDPKQLENARRDMTEAFFQQELMCAFLEGEGSVFRGVRGVTTSKPEKPIIGRMYVMAVDLGRVQDYTVIVVYDRKTNRQVYQDRFKTIEWPFQKKRIVATARHYNNALVMLDVTGLGDPVADDLIRSGVAVEPFQLTNQSKKDIIEKLSIWIEQRRFKMLSLEETLFEFDNYSYVMLPSGRVRYEAPVGFHDDIVIAQALAVWALQPITVPVKPKEVSKIRAAYLDQVDARTRGPDLVAV